MRARHVQALLINPFEYAFIPVATLTQLKKKILSWIVLQTKKVNGRKLSMPSYLKDGKKDGDGGVVKVTWWSMSCRKSSIGG
jgi:hypothetical protein